MVRLLQATVRIESQPQLLNLAGSRIANANLLTTSVDITRQNLNHPGQQIYTNLGTKNYYLEMDHNDEWLLVMFGYFCICDLLFYSGL